MNKPTHINVRFRSETYRVTIEMAEALNARGHLVRRLDTYVVPDDPYIYVRGEPIQQAA